MQFDLQEQDIEAIEAILQGENKSPQSVFIQKPEGYVAKDAVFRVLKEWEEEGRNVNDISNSYISQKIKDHYEGFEENPNTVSAYKSQYKKSTHFRPGNSDVALDDSLTPGMFRVGLKLAPILQKYADKEVLSKEQMLSLLNLIGGSLDYISETL